MLAGFLLGMLVVEGGLRFLTPQPRSWLEVYRSAPELGFYALQPDVTALVDTGETRWTIRTDAQGFRIPLGLALRSDRDPAVWLGDSFTFGYGVDDESCFVRRVELDPKCRYRFTNTAVP